MLAKAASARSCHSAALRAGCQLLGQQEQRLRFDLGQFLGYCALVQALYRFAESRNTAAQYLTGELVLFLWQRLKHR